MFSCRYIYDIVCMYSMYIIYYYILLYGDIYYSMNYDVYILIDKFYIYIHTLYIYTIYTIYISTLYIYNIYIYYIYTIYTIYTIHTLYTLYIYIYIYTIYIYIYTIYIISCILLPGELPHRPPRSAGWRSTRWSSRWFRCRRCWCALDLAVPGWRNGTDGEGITWRWTW